MRFQFFLLLIFIAFPASAFSQFDYLFPENQPYSTYAYLLAFPGCNGVEFDLNPLERSLIPSDDALVLQNYDGALLDLRNARNIKNLFPGASDLALIPATFLNIICHQYGVSGVNHAAAAMKEIFKSTDEKFSKLDFMQGNEYSFSAGITGQKSVYEAEISSRKADNPLPKEVIGSSEKLAMFWGTFPSSDQNYDFISYALGKGGSLNQLVQFEREMDAAMLNMENFRQNASRTYPSVLFDAEGLLDEVKEQKLPSIGSAAIAYSPQDGLYGGHFYDSATEADALIKKAKFLHLEAERAYSAKQRGYVAFSLAREQEAISLLGTAAFDAGESLSLARQIEKKLLSEIEAAESAISQRMRFKDGEPLVYDYLEEKMAEYDEMKKGKSGISDLGGRINHLLDAIGMLKGVLEYSEATDSLAEKISALVGREKEAEGLLSRAEADGVAVLEDKEKLKAVKASLSGEEISRNGKLVAEIEADIDGIRNSVLLKASEKYSDAERMFFELDSMREYLPSSDRLKLEGYAKFIDGSGIDYETAMGSLKEFDSFVLRKSEELEMRLPGLVKAHLEGNLLIREIPEPEKFGEAAKFTVYVSFENQLQFSAIGIRLKLPLPTNCRLLNATEGTFLEKDGSSIFLAIESNEKEYFAVLEFEMVPNEFVERKEKTEEADFDSVRKTIAFEFNTTRQSKLLLELPLLTEDYEINYAYPFEKHASGGFLRIVADAPIGRNSISIEYSISEPFSLSIAKSVSPGIALYDFIYEGTKLDLPSAKLDFSTYTECEITKVLVMQSDFVFSDSSKGNFLFFSLSARDWGEGQRKKLSLKLICNNGINSLISSSLQNITDSGSLAETIALEAAKQQLSEGNYAAALSFLNQQTASSPSPSSNARLDSICQTAQFMLQEKYEEEFGMKLNSECVEISSLSGEGNKADAEKALSSSEQGIEAFLSGKLETARKKCKAGCDSGMLDALQSLSIMLLSKDYFKGVREAMRLDSSFEAKTDSDALLYRSKLDAFLGYSELKQDAESAISDFILYYSANLEDSKSLKYYDSYKAGSTAKSDLDKLLKELALIDNALRTNESEKYSSALIKTKIEAVGPLLALLISANNEIKSLAETEFDTAIKRAGQFEDGGSNSDLQKAQDFLDSGNYFSSYMLAKSINSTNQQPKKGENFDPTPYALPSIVILIGGAYFLLLRKPNEQIIVEGETKD